MPRRLPRLLFSLVFWGGLFPVALLHAAAAPARAQAESRDWRVCFTAGVQSCTEFVLTTAPQFVGATRSGTFVDLLVRHETRGGVESALQTVSFFFAPTGAPGAADVQPLTPLALFGAPAAPAPGVWQAAAASGTGAALGDGSTDVLLVRDTTTAFRDFPAPTATQWIGGCAGPLADAYHTSPLASCGGGAYGFSFATAAAFEAAQVQALALDVYAADLLGPDAPGVGFCRVSTTDGSSVGFDGADPGNAAPCAIAGAAGSVVPEPSSWALIGVGLAGIAAAARRRAS